jgi:hemerythrin
LGVFEKRLRLGDEGLTLEMLEFFSAWLASHIGVQDRAYASFLNAHGVR